MAGVLNKIFAKVTHYLVNSPTNFSNKT